MHADRLQRPSLDRFHHALGNTTQVVAYLTQGLQIAEQLGRRENEAKIRKRLGMALWGHGDPEAAQAQLDRAAHLLQAIRREAHRGPQDNKMQLFDLQTASYQAGSVKATNCVGFRDYKVLAGIPGVAG